MVNLKGKIQECDDDLFAENEVTRKTKSRNKGCGCHNVQVESGKTKIQSRAEEARE